MCDVEGEASFDTLPNTLPETEAKAIGEKFVDVEAEELKNMLADNMGSAAWRHTC